MNKADRDKANDCGLEVVAWMVREHPSEFNDYRGSFRAKTVRTSGGTPLVRKSDADARIAELEAQLAALKAQEPVGYTTAGMIECIKALPFTGRIGVRAEKTARWAIPLYAAPVKQEVVMPERIKRPTRLDDDYRDGWNDCLDEVARLNGGQAK